MDIQHAMCKLFLSSTLFNDALTIKSTDVSLIQHSVIIHFHFPHISIYLIYLCQLRSKCWVNNLFFWHKNLILDILNNNSNWNKFEFLLNTFCLMLFSPLFFLSFLLHFPCYYRNWCFVMGTCGKISKIFIIFKSNKFKVRNIA